MFGLFAAKKTFNAQVNSTQSNVEIPPGETLLNAALNAGIPWPHNCRVGSCGTCRCTLKNGKIKPLNDFSYVLDEDELDNGMILACQTRALTDLEISVNLDDSSPALSIAQEVSGVIRASHQLTHDILEIEIQLDDELPDYLAGQYAEISTSDIQLPRSYSFAEAPTRRNSGTVSFYIRHVPEGEMTTWLHSDSRIGEKVTVNGPHGGFFLRKSESPIICIAGGSGLAPIKAVLEQLADEKSTRPVTFLFGARTRKDLYCLNEIDNIQTAYPGALEFIPVLSEEPAESDWSGRRGLVTEFIPECSDESSGYQAYLCGPPIMIDKAIESLIAKGIEENQIYFDKFLDASHSPRK